MAAVGQLHRRQRPGLRVISTVSTWWQWSRYRKTAYLTLVEGQLLLWIFNSHYEPRTLRMMTFSFPVISWAVATDRSGEFLNLILFVWWQISLRKGSTGKENLTDESLCPLHCVALWIEQPVIGLPFLDILIFLATPSRWMTFMLIFFFFLLNDAVMIRLRSYQ